MHQTRLPKHRFIRFFERECIVGPNGRSFSTFSPQGIGNTVWSFARQAQLSLDVIDSLGLGNVKVGTTGRLAVYETSCLDVGEDLIKLLFVKAAEAGIEMGLDRFKTQGEMFLEVNTCNLILLKSVSMPNIFRFY